MTRGFRTHWRLGATVRQPVHRSMVIIGSIADWQSWTGMYFPQSGQYIVPNALVPVTVDIQRQQVEYIEPEFVDAALALRLSIVSIFE
ncbi:hypothetical protein AB6F55_11420 [Providencia hangzhouensis]